MNQPDFKPVYILGAGASEMLHAPLVKDFLLVARSLRYSHKLRPDLADHFEKVFQYQDQLFASRRFLGINLDNLETLFSILDMDWQTTMLREASDGFPHHHHDELDRIRESFFILVIETLRHSVVAELPTKYKNFIQAFATASQSCFITFNYDTAIEEVFQVKPGGSQSNYYLLPYSQYLPPANPVVLSPPMEGRSLLKLHGSVGWVGCKNCSMFMPGRKPITSLEFSSTQYTHDKKCPSPQPINLIVPPTWYKVNYQDTITRQWYHSILELSLATHIIIIGYSFPRTDVFFDQLLTLGLRQNRNLKQVIIINPSEDDLKSAHKLFDQHFARDRVFPFARRFIELSSVERIATEQDLNHWFKNIQEGNPL